MRLYTEPRCSPRRFINRRADDFVGGDEAVRFVSSNCPGRRRGGTLHRALLVHSNKQGNDDTER